MSESSKWKYSWPDQWLMDQMPPEVQDIMDKAETTLGRGAFSIVVPVNDTQVLKVSTCEASRTLLPQLQDAPVPGLPVVYRCFGQVGRVLAVKGYYDELPLHAYLMERLYDPFEFGKTFLRKDACPRGDAMRARSKDDALGAYRWLQVKTQAVPWKLERAFLADQTRHHPLVTRLRNLFVRTRFEPLACTVQRLSHRVMQQEWTFDWVGRFHANVMLSQWGEPILADPVYAPKQPCWLMPYEIDDY